MTPAPATPVQPAPLRCRCGLVLGAVDGAALTIGGVRVLGGVRLQCPGCGRVRRFCAGPAVRDAGMARDV